MAEGKKKEKGVRRQKIKAAYDFDGKLMFRKNDVKRIAIASGSGQQLNISKDFLGFLDDDIKKQTSALVRKADGITYARKGKIIRGDDVYKVRSGIDYKGLTRTKGLLDLKRYNIDIDRYGNLQSFKGIARKNKSAKKVEGKKSGQSSKVTTGASTSAIRTVSNSPVGKRKEAPQQKIANTVAPKAQASSNNINLKNEVVIPDTIVNRSQRKITANTKYDGYAK